MFTGKVLIKIVMMVVMVLMMVMMMMMMIQWVLLWRVGTSSIPLVAGGAGKMDGQAPFQSKGNPSKTQE